jgi:hypothetical protein
MMSVLAYGLILLGCADDGTACRQLDLPPIHYAAAASCQAEVETVLMSDTAMRADYPVVEARCVPLKTPRSDADKIRLAAGS